MSGMPAGLEWSRIADAPFGIEVNVDPAVDLGDEQRTALRELYCRDGLLRLRSAEPMSIESQANFCRIFGPVPSDLHDTYLVSNIAPDGILADLELLFHHDMVSIKLSSGSYFRPFLDRCQFMAAICINRNTHDSKLAPSRGLYLSNLITMSVIRVLAASSASNGGKSEDRKKR